MIELKNISFSYGGGLNVLNDVSFNIKGGEFVGVLGPNGSGKTTLLKIMSGVFKPSAGEILLDGKKIERIKTRQRARSIAVVPQETTIPFSFSTLEVVLMGRAPYLKFLGFETESDIAVARQAMNEMDVSSFERRCIQDLSGGEKQRVIVARALAQEPKILLLDEPTTYLDIRHQMELYRLLKKKNVQEKLTVVTVMHDINMASTFCDKIFFLKQGALMAEGTPHDVVKYATIKSIFDTEVYVGINDLTGMPYYVPFQ